MKEITVKTYRNEKEKDAKEIKKSTVFYWNTLFRNIREL